MKFLKRIEAMISQDEIYVVINKHDKSLEMAFSREADAAKFIDKRIRDYAILTVPFVKWHFPK
jgi:hypothetical protein